MKAISNLLDRLACHVGIWSLRRLYGADCETNVHDDWPCEPELNCISCDAKRFVVDMQGILKE